jgi:hypothetical protein
MELTCDKGGSVDRLWAVMVTGQNWCRSLTLGPPPDGEDDRSSSHRRLCPGSELHR